MNKLKAIDLFAGIGGIRLGFENAFGEGLETVFASEWDKYAQETYKRNFDDSFAISGDITKIDNDEIPTFDICLAGFPCQAFSLAGKRMGFEDDYKGMCRGTLFQEIVRICEHHRPKVIFCENVKGLTVHDRGRTFKIILKAFEQIGYTCYYKILNSKDFGVPQNRERIYIVCFRNDIDSSAFSFPKATGENSCLKDILEDAPVPSKYYLSDVYMDTLRKHKARHVAKGNGFGYEIRPLDGVAGAIVCGGMGRERNLIIDRREHSMTPMTHIRGEINKEDVRKMTPREWARLQGFPDTFKLPLSDTHLYKQLGNSVTVNVIEAIAGQIKSVLERNESEMIIGSKNKGDWSEFYVLLYLLGMRELYAADEQLHRANEFSFPIKRIMREDVVGEHVDFVLEGIDKVEIYLNSKLLREMSSEQFAEEAKALYADMKQGRGSFDIPHAEQFLHSINLNRLAAPSSDVVDIKMEVHDTYTSMSQTMGFSIKSYIGGAPTLLNASGATNFVYEVTGLNDSLIDGINAIDTETKIVDRIRAIADGGGTMEYRRTANPTFSNNLVMIDSRMEEIIAEVLRYSYESNELDCRRIIEHIETENPLNYPREGVYTYKFKQFLCAKALGMQPSSDWAGEDNANGGYIVAKSDGEVLAYHLYNRDKFMQYLFDSTRLEHGSIDKHKYLRLYREDGRTYIKLNLQIRFKGVR